MGESEETEEIEATKSSHRNHQPKLLSINSEDEDGEDFPLSKTQMSNFRKRSGGLLGSALIRPSKTLLKLKDFE